MNIVLRSIEKNIHIAQDIAFDYISEVKKRTEADSRNLPQREDVT
jgi:hypothetical protein